MEIPEELLNSVEACKRLVTDTPHKDEARAAMAAINDAMARHPLPFDAALYVACAFLVATLRDPGITAPGRSMFAAAVSALAVEYAGVLEDGEAATAAGMVN